MSLHENAKNLENKIHNTEHSKANKNNKEGTDEIKVGMDNIKDGVEGLVQLTVKDAKEKYATMEENLGNYLKANPLKAIGLVLVAGFALSKLL